MKKTLSVIACSLSLLVAACNQTPTAVDVAQGGDSMVITEGIAAPAAQRASGTVGALSTASVGSNLGGSTTTRVALDGCAKGESTDVTVTYTITGRQTEAASFKIYKAYKFDGASWVPDLTNEQTVSVPARAGGDAPTVRDETITLTNGDALISGDSELTFSPRDLVTSGQAKLDIKGAKTTIYANFNNKNCPAPDTKEPPPNTAPSITVPNLPITVEATGQTTPVAFVVTAEDSQDTQTEINSRVTCWIGSDESNSIISPYSLALGTYAVTCKVIDSGGLTASGTFTITVEDTTAPILQNVPTSSLEIARNMDGYMVDVSGVTAVDAYGVDPNPTVNCIPEDRQVAIGGRKTFTCTATDFSNNSASQQFTTEVTLGDIENKRFLQPVNADGTSLFKLKSTIPLKFLPPKFSDGTLATKLDTGLQLTVTRIKGVPTGTAPETVDFSSGSTVWRYDDSTIPGKYVFNLSSKSEWFTAGEYKAEVRYAGILVASNNFSLK